MSPWPRLPPLEQHQLDLIGLGLVCVAAFLAFVLYMGTGGRRGGGALEEGLRFALGGAAYLVPSGLAAAGVVLVLRPLLPAVRPFRAGAVCLLLGATLGLSAGSFGLGPGRGAPFAAARPRLRGRPRRRARRAPLLGRGDAVLGRRGAHPVRVPLAGGLLLVTGASIAGIVAATRRRVATTSRRVASTTGRVRRSTASRRPC